jgi:energy-coupling factor transporter transmembrane protein EcfT
MISSPSLHRTHSTTPSQSRIGTLGYLAIFAWSLAAVMTAPARRLLWIAGLCLLVAALVHPRSFRRLMRLRWLVMIALLAIPPIFLLGELNRSLAGVRYSSEGLLSSIQITARILVVLLAVDGLSASVDISSVAGLLERAGLHGLGFSVGVALNLLPALQQSALNSWRSLWMRGGLRKQRWRALRYLAITVVVNSLGRAEEIALAAEARAFSPAHARHLPVKAGTWDRVILILCPLLLLAFLLLP